MVHFLIILLYFNVEVYQLCLDVTELYGAPLSSPEVTFVTGLLEIGRGGVFTPTETSRCHLSGFCWFPGLVVRHHNSFDVDGLQSVEKTLPPLRPSKAPA